MMETFSVACEDHGIMREVWTPDGVKEKYIEPRSDCMACFLEALSEHVSFRNGEMILHRVKHE